MAAITKDLGIATAYGYAKSKGYTGTEEEFATLMAGYATVGQAAAASALKAEGFAVGEQDGTPVTSGSPYYENSAEYYRDEAKDIADSVESTGAAQVQLVEAEGTRQIGAVGDKGAEVLASIPSDYTTLSGDVSDLKSAMLLEAETIPDTVQAIAFDSSGNVSSITHSRSGSAVRTDAFTFGTNTITEVRTLSSGESLTIVTNIDTLETTVTFAAAA